MRLTLAVLLLGALAGGQIMFAPPTPFLNFQCAATPAELKALRLSLRGVRGAAGFRDAEVEVVKLGSLGRAYWIAFPGFHGRIRAGLLLAADGQGFRTVLRVKQAGWLSVLPGPARVPDIAVVVRGATAAPRFRYADRLYTGDGLTAEAGPWQRISGLTAAQYARARRVLGAMAAAGWKQVRALWANTEMAVIRTPDCDARGNCRTVIVGGGPWYVPVRVRLRSTPASRVAFDKRGGEGLVLEVREPGGTVEFRQYAGAPSYTRSLRLDACERGNAAKAIAVDCSTGKQPAGGSR